MIKSEVIELLTILSKEHPDEFKKLDKKRKMQMVMEWLEILEPFPFQDCRDYRCMDVQMIKRRCLYEREKAKQRRNKLFGKDFYDLSEEDQLERARSVCKKAIEEYENKNKCND